MNRNLNLKTLAQLAAIFLIAFALKYHYSTATVNDLRWILAPTTFLVETFTGERFTFEPFAGYMNGDHTFLIAAACSGVNFLIIAFLMLALGKVWRDPIVEWRSIPLALLASYAATLVANTVRIVVALQMHALDLKIGSLNGEELHRIEGIVVYFGFLLLLFIAKERSATRGAGVKYLLLVYYAVTLGIPLVRGSYADPAFWQHAAFVLLIPMILIIPFGIFSFLRSRLIEVV